MLPNLRLKKIDLEKRKNISKKDIIDNYVIKHPEVIDNFNKKLNDNTEIDPIYNAYSYLWNLNNKNPNNITHNRKDFIMNSPKASFSVSNSSSKQIKVKSYNNKKMKSPQGSVDLTDIKKAHEIDPSIYWNYSLEERLKTDQVLDVLNWYQISFRYKNPKHLLLILLICALREFHEETGINLENFYSYKTLYDTNFLEIKNKKRITTFYLRLDDSTYEKIVSSIKNDDHNPITPEISHIYYNKYIKYKNKYLKQKEIL